MKKVSIITGSTLGGAEYVGDHLADLLEEMDFSTDIHNQPNLDDIDIDSLWLLVVSTHGAGDYPDNIKPFIQQLESVTQPLSSVEFAVVAIGDSSYDTFCAAGKSLQNTLKEHGAIEKYPLLEIDVTQNSIPEEPAELWLKQHIC
ncbi:FMN-binding protein MioC [Aliivibrio fischeri ES114]|uniref:FMN-binding protein MioC n=1 Tax=Aliivibrio fischeri (strain ATCC 700601 / ES114) TaxID=312309 RepID=Q5E900_ALIF1|nr:FMN-binding protein MioC [Aliivibrio fischeri]AAW84496.1 FMN-binding protein MioC [Aliivibrio fischeri ES114]KLU79045.1 FMN-binding protein MioC [Aliivibrio fischeri]MUK38208.1 FMN-binding protein MioC [Aliivibrio fischeri]MUL02461.1 FMN-binding protein MioC [Aliivibrio fischeri]MUL07309.1 FMN-binding protein MioC [Aliivibrio fischeri]